MTPVPRLTEGVDYTIGPDGMLVFTSSYLLARGTCCGNGCRNCPYTKKSDEPMVPPQFEKSTTDR